MLVEAVCSYDVGSSVKMELPTSAQGAVDKVKVGELVGARVVSLKSLDGANLLMFVGNRYGDLAVTTCHH